MEAIQQAPERPAAHPVLLRPEASQHEVMDYFAMLLDTEDRRLGEWRVRGAFAGHAPYVTRTCPYPGSRRDHPKPMNVSALAQMTSHWKAIVGLTDRLRTEYVNVVAGDRREILRVIDAHVLARIGQLTVAYAARRAFAHRAPAALPAPLAATAKATVGYSGVLYSIIGFMAQSGLVTEARLTAAAFFDIVEGQRKLIGAEEVCAGPPGLITGLTVALMEGDATSADDGALALRLAGGDEFLAYAFSESALQLALGLAGLRARSILAPFGLGAAVQRRPGASAAGAPPSGSQILGTVGLLSGPDAAVQVEAEMKRIQAALGRAGLCDVADFAKKIYRPLPMPADPNVEALGAIPRGPQPDAAAALAGLLQLEFDVAESASSIQARIDQAILPGSERPRLGRAFVAEVLELGAARLLATSLDLTIEDVADGQCSVRSPAGTCVLTFR